MLKKALFLVRLIVFLLTIRYAVMFTRCFLEYAWTANPNGLLTATFKWRLNYLESENIRQLYRAIEELPVKYKSEQVFDFNSIPGRVDPLAGGKLVWAEPVDEAIQNCEKEFARDESSREEFLTAYQAYLETATEILTESREAVTRMPGGGFEKGLHKLKEARLDVLREGREKHWMAVRDMLGKIPYSYANAMDAWQASSQYPGRDVEPLELYPGIACEQVWTRRYGDEDLAKRLVFLSFILLFLGLVSGGYRTLEELLLGTRVVQFFHKLILGELWSVYYDTPRRALLWLLETFWPEGNGPTEQKAVPGQSVIVVETLH